MELLTPPTVAAFTKVAGKEIFLLRAAAFAHPTRGDLTTTTDADSWTGTVLVETQRASYLGTGTPYYIDNSRSGEADVEQRMQDYAQDTLWITSQDVPGLFDQSELFDKGALFSRYHGYVFAKTVGDIDEDEYRLGDTYLRRDPSAWAMCCSFGELDGDSSTLNFFEDSRALVGERIGYYPYPVTIEVDNGLYGEDPPYGTGIRFCLVGAGGDGAEVWIDWVLIMGRTDSVGVIDNTEMSWGFKYRDAIAITDVRTDEGVGPFSRDWGYPANGFPTATAESGSGQFVAESQTATGVGDGIEPTGAYDELNATYWDTAVLEALTWLVMVMKPLALPLETLLSDVFSRTHGEDVRWSPSPEGWEYMCHSEHWQDDLASLLIDDPANNSGFVIQFHQTLTTILVDDFLIDGSRAGMQMGQGDRLTAWAGACVVTDYTAADDPFWLGDNPVTSFDHHLAKSLDDLADFEVIVDAEIDWVDEFDDPVDPPEGEGWYFLEVGMGDVPYINDLGWMNGHSAHLHNLIGARCSVGLQREAGGDVTAVLSMHHQDQDENAVYSMPRDDRFVIDTASLGAYDGPEYHFKFQVRRNSVRAKVWSSGTEPASWTVEGFMPASIYDSGTSTWAWDPHDYDWPDDYAVKAMMLRVPGIGYGWRCMVPMLSSSVVDGSLVSGMTWWDNLSVATVFGEEGPGSVHHRLTDDTSSEIYEADFEAVSDGKPYAVITDQQRAWFNISGGDALLNWIWNDDASSIGQRANLIEVAAVCVLGVLQRFIRNAFRANDPDASPKATHTGSGLAVRKTFRAKDPEGSPKMSHTNAGLGMSGVTFRARDPDSP